MRKGKKWGAAVLKFAGLLILAAGLSNVLVLLKMNHWVHVFFVFALTKVIADVIIAVFKLKESKYIFFEDYFKEVLLFFAVAAICVLSIALVQHYMLGKVWSPLPAAATVMIWQ